MGSIKVRSWVYGRVWGLVFLTLRVFSPVSLFPQSAVPSLGAEISRLEKLTGNAGGAASSPGERYAAFLSLARLYRLSGDCEAALRACTGALAAQSGGGQALLEQGRLLVSLGEYERAEASLRSLLNQSRESELVLQGRCLMAQLEAFRSGNTQALAALAGDPDFGDYKSGIYYTLWKLTGLGLWKNRLGSEFPQSPEAKIAAGKADAAATPLWLLFPGREGIALSAPLSPVSAPPVQEGGKSPLREGGKSAGILQTGLFSREENAQAMATALKKAGFEAHVSRRGMNSGDYWVVSVPGGEDINAMLMGLKNAGFESFPVY
jgi:tetratricopeptide (TPR) repeat protein